MAELSTSGLEDIIGSLEELVKLPDEVVLEMLTAEAEVVAEAQEAEAKAMGVYDTGETAMSVSYGNKLINKGGKKCIYVYPRGTHKSGNKRRTAEVAYVNEYGVKSRKMPAKPFIRTANEKSADAAHDAAARVYDEFLKSKNL